MLTSKDLNGWLRYISPVMRPGIKKLWEEWISMGRTKEPSVFLLDLSLRRSYSDLFMVDQLTLMLMMLNLMQLLPRNDSGKMSLTSSMKSMED